MPYKRRRISFRRRRRSRHSGKRRRFRRFHRKNARAYRRSKRSYRRYRRSMRGRGRRGNGRYIKRNYGIVATQEKIPKYIYKHTRRVPRLNKWLKQKIDNHLGSKYHFDFGYNNYLRDVTGTRAGDAIIPWIYPIQLARIWQHVQEQESRRYAQGGYTGNYTAAGWWRGMQGCNFKFSKINFRYRVTNQTRAYIKVRFYEWKAKRDIPINFGYTAAVTAGDPLHPISAILSNLSTYATANGMDINQVQGLQNNSNASAIQSGVTEQPDYYRNSYETFPAVRYYFKIKRKKECRIEPGAYVDFVLSYTPKMALSNYMWSIWNHYPQYTGIAGFTTPYGNVIWKGLNDTGPLIQIVGTDALQGVDPPGTTPPVNTIFGAIIRESITIDGVNKPLHYRSRYVTANDITNNAYDDAIVTGPASENIAILPAP